VDIQKLMDGYVDWIKSEICCEKIGAGTYYRITVPYLDNAHDYLEIYVRQDGDEIFFTDDGAVIHGLQMAGRQIAQDRRRFLSRILNPYGVQINGDELTAKAPAEKFAWQMHLLIHAMLRVGSMFDRRV